MVINILQPGGAGAAGKVPAQRRQQPEARRAFRTLKAWSLAYLGVSVLVLAASVVVLQDADLGSAVGSWIRCGVVALIAAVIYALAVRAQGGQRRSYRVLRVFAWLESIGFLVVAVAVPGYPLWLRVASLVVGVFAIGTAVASGNRTIRAVFTDDV